MKEVVSLMVAVAVTVAVVVVVAVVVKEEPFLTDVSQVPLRTGLCRLVSSAYRDHRWVTSCIRNLPHAPHPPRCWRLKKRPSLLLFLLLP